MPLASATAENAATNAVTALCADIALHTASPSTTGANELSGSTRQTSTFGSSSSGTATNTNAPAVPQPASTTTTHFGEWSAATAGTFEIGGALGSSLTTGASAATVTFAAGSISVGSS
jgi:hypothetical protein